MFQEIYNTFFATKSEIFYFIATTKFFLKNMNIELDHFIYTFQGLLAYEPTCF